MRVRSLTIACLLQSACVGSDPAGGWSDVCIDLDGDGRGLHCHDGDDCDDQDRTVWADCAHCQPRTAEGCACDTEGVREACGSPRGVGATGELLCEVGTRTCRAGMWSACEDVSLRATPAALALRFRAELASDAAPVTCSPCHPDCYQLDDPLDPSDASLGTNIVAPLGGGITLSSSSDGGVPSEPSAPPACVPGTAPDLDCDGLPDAFDPYPTTPPFATNNDTLFLDLAAGQTKNRDFGLTFSLNSADVYFYLDMTGSMNDERDQLISSLTSGNFLPDGGAGMDCADRDFDGTPDNSLKNGGIAGNIACLIRDAQLGAGWFRDIPFYGPYSGSNQPVADTDFQPFEHRQDITSDVAAVQSALSAFTTRGNYNVPEGSMQGLWSLATGSELYMGWNRPGVPARTTCPADRWGYPCFRTASVPIVVHITDAPLQNGPSPTSAARANTLAPCMEVCGSYSCTCSTSKPHPLNYDSSVLAGMRGGTDPHYRPLTSSAETLLTFQDVGTINDALVTYTGTTEGKASDVTYVHTGSCPSYTSAWPSSNQTGADVVFRFSVSSTKTLTISTRGSRFDTTLLVRKTTSLTPLVCTDDIGGGLLTSEITRSFTAGDYIVVLKGYSSSARGMFQITFGDTALATTSSFNAKTWLGPAGDGVDGIRSALTSRGVRVVTVNSNTDAYLAEQSNVLSTATGALSAAGSPLTFNINSDGTGMGTAVVEAIDRLSGGLAMNVTPRLVESPDSPSPRHFTLAIEAIDQLGDGCEAPIDTDGDPAHLPDTHVRCRPGATPHFRVALGNPAVPNNVPVNPSDPLGGYNMRMELIGDGQYVVDTVPVYIIPEDVVPLPTGPVYAASGSYEQSAHAGGCLGTERPIWTPLTWDADVPAGTSVVFEMCTGDTPAQAASCALSPAVRLTGGGPCVLDSQCADGFCASTGQCQYAEGPDCTADAQCGPTGTCVTGTCRFAGPSADLAAALALGQQARAYVRTRITLNANDTRTLAPTVGTWGVKYTCAPNE